MISRMVLDDVKQALASRVNTPLTTYLEARKADLVQQLIVADEKLIKNLQGRIQEVQELLDLLNKARESA